MVSLKAMVEAKGALLTGARGEEIFRQEVVAGGMSATAMVHAAISKATPMSKAWQGRAGGTLAMAWQRRILSMGVPFASEVFNPLPYGEVVEKGSRPHVILPRYKKALAFLPYANYNPAEAGAHGIEVVVKAVHHPGTKPTRFVEKTVQRLDGPWLQLWERVVSRVVERLS